MTTAEIHELTDDELVKQVEDANKEHLNLRIQARIGQLENSARLRLLRREIARFKTEQRSRVLKKSGTVVPPL